MHSTIPARATRSSRPPANFVPRDASSPVDDVIQATGTRQIQLTVKRYRQIVEKYSGSTAIQRHQFVQDGIETSDLIGVCKSFTSIEYPDLLKSIGVSAKTLERKESDRLNPKHSDAALALMEVTENAEKVLGSRLAAEQWLIKPAVALDRVRPIDLLTSAPGIEAVKDLLTRIEHGVYS